MRIFNLIIWWWRTGSLRPLLWWVLALVASVAFPVPRSWVLVLIVGLGVALTSTVLRLGHSARQVRRHTAPWLGSD